jgi:hypothetical protein
MMTSLIALILLARDAVSEAGTAYREAQAMVTAEKYEEAVQLLRGAVQRLGEESEELKYRDDVSRRKHSYYPYFEWGRARLLQAQLEPSIYNKRDMIAEAIGRLGQSRHPQASIRLDEAKSKLTAVQEAIALDGSFSAVKTRIEVLGNGERFQEALKQLQVANTKFMGRTKELEEVRVALNEKQVAVVKRYEQMVVQRLSDVVLMDPATGGESIAPLLRPALVPPEVTEQGGAGFDWLRRFIALWEKHSETIRKASQLPGDRVIAAADELDAAGLEALTLKLPSGFRAARHLGQAGRMAKLRDIATGSEDVLDTKTAAEVAQSAVASSRAAAEAASRQPEEVQELLQKDVATHERQVADEYKKIGSSAKERDRLTAPILRAEELLENGDTVGDMASLTKLKDDLFELESEATFGTLTARLRARALFAHGLTEAMMAFLEGKPFPQVVERSRLPTWRAYGFDPKVDARWASKVSPKLQKVFDQIRPQ